MTGIPFHVFVPGRIQGASCICLRCSYSLSVPGLAFAFLISSSSLCLGGSSCLGGLHPRWLWSWFLPHWQLSIILGPCLGHPERQLLLSLFSSSDSFYQDPKMKSSHFWLHPSYCTNFILLASNLSWVLVWRTWAIHPSAAAMLDLNLPFCAYNQARSLGWPWAPLILFLSRLNFPEPRE